MIGTTHYSDDIDLWQTKFKLQSKQYFKITKYELKGIKQAVNTWFHFKVTKSDIGLSVEGFLNLIESVFLSKLRELQSSNCRWVSSKVKSINQKEYITYPLVGAYTIWANTSVDRIKAFIFDLLYKNTKVRYDLQLVAPIFKNYDKKDDKNIELGLFEKVRAIERVLILELDLDSGHQLKYVKFSKRNNKTLLAEPLVISPIGFVERKKRLKPRLKIQVA